MMSSGSAWAVYKAGASLRTLKRFNSVAGCLPSMYQTLSSSLVLKAITTLIHKSRGKLNNLFKLHGAEAVEGKNKSTFQISVFLTFGSPFFLMA